MTSKENPKFFMDRLRRAPLLVTFGAILLYFFILAAPSLLSSTSFGGDVSKTPQSLPKNQLPLEIGLAISALFIVFLLGWGRDARVTSKPSWSGFWYAVPPAAITLLILGIGVATASLQGIDATLLLTSELVMATLLLVIFVGVFEETLFRGIVLHGLEIRFGPIIALLGSSVLFGSMHYVNWVGGQNLLSTHQQVIHAALSGVLYGAIALRCRSIWPGVFLHSLWDFTVFVNGALGAGNPVQGDQVTTSEGFGAMIFLFLLRYFEPILGLIALLGWFRWSKKQNPTRSDNEC